jgi:hypothetical protein
VGPRADLDVQKISSPPGFDPGPYQQPSGKEYGVKSNRMRVNFERWGRVYGLMGFLSVSSAHSVCCTNTNVKKFTLFQFTVFTLQNGKQT